MLLAGFDLTTSGLHPRVLRLSKWYDKFWRYAQLWGCIRRVAPHSSFYLFIYVFSGLYMDFLLCINNFPSCVQLPCNAWTRNKYETFYSKPCKFRRNIISGALITSKKIYSKFCCHHDTPKSFFLYLQGIDLKNYFPCLFLKNDSKC